MSHGARQLLPSPTYSPANRFHKRKMADSNDVSAQGEPVNPEQARREKLKKAGEAYFERILAQAGSEAIPPKSKFTALPPVSSVDQDLEAVGAVVEGARNYIIGTIFVASLAVVPVFAKVGMQ